MIKTTKYHKHLTVNSSTFLKLLYIGEALQQLGMM